MSADVSAANLDLLSADKPLTDPKDDRLGYAPFAKHLAESIVRMSPPEGLVVAIFGPWGSGKTTVLNFVVHHLEQEEESERPVIVRFNPWWFSGHEDLTRRFFEQLRAIFMKRKDVEENLRKQIADFAELVSEAPIPYSAVSKWIERFLRPREKDIPELKTKIVEAFRKQDKRALIIIDDIDRLTANEIQQLFRVIRGVADFPNAIYLLAFDKVVAAKALEEMQHIPGEDYLEKIVQVPFELPLPDRTSLRRLLFERIDATLVDSPGELFDQNYWANVYFDGIDHFIQTPRDIVRLINALTVDYPAVKSEVNAVDFIAIESIRVFSPLAYDIIRRNEEEFAGHIAVTGYSAEAEVTRRRNFHESWLNKIQEEDRKAVKSLLLRLFPKFGTVFGGTFYDAGWESEWRAKLRVCSPDIFYTYFHLAVPEGNISYAEMKATQALMGDSQAFGARLVELANQKRPDGTTRARAFLERLEDYTPKDIALEHIPLVLGALFDIGDMLLRPEDEGGMLDFGNDIRIGRIIWQLLKRLDAPRRFEVLKHAMSRGHAVSTIVHEVLTLGQQHGKYGEKQPSPKEERLINAEQLRELELMALQKVKDAAEQDYKLLEVPHLPRVLHIWQAWAGEEEARNWIQKALEDDTQLITLLEKFLHKSFRSTIGERVPERRYSLDPKRLEPFLQPSAIIDRVRSLSNNKSLTEDQRVALAEFIRGYEMREQGKNPESPLD